MLFFGNLTGFFIPGVSRWLFIKCQEPGKCGKFYLFMSQTNLSIVILNSSDAVVNGISHY